MRDVPAAGCSCRRSPVGSRAPNDDLALHERAFRRARRGDQGRPGVLAWFVGLGIHLALALLLVI